jgi:hypothetical protein
LYVSRDNEVATGKKPKKECERKEKKRLKNEYDNDEEKKMTITIGNTYQSRALLSLLLLLIDDCA